LGTVSSVAHLKSRFFQLLKLLGPKATWINRNDITCKADIPTQCEVQPRLRKSLNAIVVLCLASSWVRTRGWSHMLLGFSISGAFSARGC
jgi:hypothetical protein